MNKLGVHAFVWEKGWRHDECARAVARTAEVGTAILGRMLSR
jgi:D-psicose/D-tagatose/L-ribulose 3-epimerase